MSTGESAICQRRDCAFGGGGCTKSSEMDVVEWRVEDTRWNRAAMVEGELGWDLDVGFGSGAMDFFLVEGRVERMDLRVGRMGMVGGRWV